MNRERKPLHPLAVTGIVLFAVGTIATLWMRDWRYGVTGLVLMLALVAVSPNLDGDR